MKRIIEYIAEKPITASLAVIFFILACISGNLFALLLSLLCVMHIV